VRRPRRKAEPKRQLSREEQAARLICQTVYRGNCACSDDAQSTCSSMKYAAIRVINLIEGRDPELTAEQRKALA
jgi:hypothetical protein